MSQSIDILDILKNYDKFNQIESYDQNRFSLFGRQNSGLTMNDLINSNI